MNGREFVFTVSDEFNGVQAKHYLRKSCGVSARTLAKLKRQDGAMTKNGVHMTSVDVLKSGDVIKLIMPCDDNEIVPVKGNIDVLYEDEYMIAVNKPCAMPVHPVRNHQSNTLANLLRAYAQDKGEQYTFRAVNRLDKDTSGIVIIAKDRMTAAALMQGQRIKKEYAAICEGEILTPGVIDLPIRLSDTSTMRRIAGDGGAPSITEYTPLKTENGCTLLRVVLKTGRTHQIRCHLSHIGHPLAGDDLYGGSRALIERQALHCVKSSFVHPFTEKNIEILAPIPQDFFIKE